MAGLLRDSEYEDNDAKMGRVAPVSLPYVYGSKGRTQGQRFKRVIAVVDTTVHGQFFMAGNHFVTFDREALPSSKVVTWFMAPAKENDEFVSGSDDTTFRLDDLSGMKVSAAIAERGHEYYIENKVRYICIDGTKGYAIVEGGEAYEVEFEYRNGEISQLICSCFCSYNCKHKFAAMLQLKETLGLIGKQYADEYERTEYFAAVSKDAALFDCLRSLPGKYLTNKQSARLYSAACGTEELIATVILN